MELGCHPLAQHKEFGKDLKEYLTKEQGAACVIYQRQQRGETLKACSYDEVVMDILSMRMGSGGCGNMVVKDNSPLRVHAVMLTALESSSSTSDAEQPSRSALGDVQSNGKIKNGEGARKTGTTPCDIKMEGA